MGRPKKQKIEQYSLTDTLARLKTFASYKVGWHDGQGLPIVQDVIDTAAILVSSLISKDIQVLVYPTIAGGVSIESIDNDEKLFIIDVYHDNTLDLTLNDTTVGKSGVTEKSLDNIIKVILGLRNSK